MTSPDPKAEAERVKAPTSVTGDTPDRPEPDEQQLKEDMSKAARKGPDKLEEVENAAEDDVSAVRPDHRENDAGQ